MQIDSPQPNVAADLSGGLHWRFWSLVPLVGVATGLSAGALMLLLRLVQRLAWPAAGADFLERVRGADALHRVLVLLAAGVIVALLRWRSGRSTGGHGAELTAQIWFHAGRIPLLSTTVRATLSMIIVGMGAALGREAAAKQMGALLASVGAQWHGLSPGQRRLLVACGTGAGIGAIYNVPFGGALFALEVLLGTLALPLIPPALAVSLIATATSWLLLPNTPTYTVAHFPLSASLILWAPLAGALAGVIAAIYVRLICFADARRPRAGAQLLLAPLLVFVALGALAIPLPTLLGNGKDVVQATLQGLLSWRTLLLLVLLRPLATALCLGSGAPGGLFTPTLSLGASFGAVAGVAWEHLWPSGAGGAYALLGAAAMLAASSQGPVCAIVLILELTRRIDPLMVPLMLAVASAALTCASLERRSLYSGRIEAARQRARRAQASAALSAEGAESAKIAGTAVTEGANGAVVSAAMRYRELLRTLLRHPATTSLRVLDETGRVIGEIDRERVCYPTRDDGPLQTATAGEFIRARERVRTPTIRARPDH